LNSNTKQLHVEIVPCVDSLLYAPVYLAIIGLAHRYHVVKPPLGTDCLVLPIGEKDYPTLKITYGTAAGGDSEVLTRLRANEASEKDTSKQLFVGICDPITVVQANYAKSGTSEHWRPDFRILGVFIDRIALSLVTRKERVPGQAPDYKRAEALHEIVRQLTDDSLNSKGLLKTIDEGGRVVYDFWSRGRTTEYLAEHYLEISSKTAPQGKKNGSDLSEFQRLTGLLSGTADVAITHSPWSIKLTEQARELEFLSRECFPSIQFPFSGIVIAEKADVVFETFLQQFISALFESLVFVTRHSEGALELLTAWAPFFRSYGLRHPAKVPPIASCALNHFLKIGCFSENLVPSWEAWEYALAMDIEWWKAKAEKRKQDTGKEALWSDLAWEVVNRSLDCRFVEKLPVGDDYLEGLHLRFMKFAKDSQRKPAGSK
jgi:hypothetical protein